MAHIIAIANQKGGVGKTTTCANLGIGLAQQGKRVLLFDADPQGSLSISLGCKHPEELGASLSTVLDKIMKDKPFEPEEGILHHGEGVDLLPANRSLSGAELALVNAPFGREKMLRRYVGEIKPAYDYILIDCMPSLGMLTINALTAANSVIIPVQTQYLAARGMEQLLETIRMVKRNTNPTLRIDGILLTMVDNRTKYAREVGALLRSNYAGKGRIHVFATDIPLSVRAAEVSAEGASIFVYDPKGKAADAYHRLTEEVMDLAKQKSKTRIEILR